MTARNPRYSRARVITILFALITAAALQLSLATPALGATTRIARCDGANLRAHPTTSAKNKIRMKAGTRVTVSGKVSGGHWHTYCGRGSHTGNTWFKVTAINGKSVKARFGVPYLYGATWLYKARTVASPSPKPSAPTPSASCTRNVSADKTGGNDATADLQRSIDASPSGAVLCLASGGQYKVNGTLHIGDRSHLTIEGQGATIFQTSRSTTRIWLIDGNSNDIDLQHTDDQGRQPEPGHVGRHLRAQPRHRDPGRGRRPSSRSCTSSTSAGDGLYLAAGHIGSTVRWADSVRPPQLRHRRHRSLRDLDHRRRAATSPSTSTRSGASRTTRSTSSPTAWSSTVSPRAPATSASPTTRSAPQPYGTGIGDQPVGHVFVVTGSSGGGPADGVTIARNTISGRPFDVGVYNNGGLRRNIAVTGNKSDTSAQGPIMNFSGVTTLTVTGNVQPLNGTATNLASCSGCTDVTISGNVTP